MSDDITLTEPYSAVGTNDLEKGAMQKSTANILSSIKVIRPGRPDIGNLIENIVTSNSNADGRVIVAACGPSELMSATRKAVHNDMYNDLSITLYTEVS